MFKDLLQFVAIAVAIFGGGFASIYYADPPTATGHTDLPYAEEFPPGDNFGRLMNPDGHNYSVHARSRSIVVITSLLTPVIEERDGKIVRRDCVPQMPARIACTTYPASREESALWRQWFS